MILTISLVETSTTARFLPSVEAWRWVGIASGVGRAYAGDGWAKMEEDVAKAV